MHYNHILLAAALLGSAFPAAAEGAKSHADANGNVGGAALDCYLLIRDKVDPAKYLNPRTLTTDKAKASELTAGSRAVLQLRLKHGAPYKWQELDGDTPPKPSDEAAEAALPAWRKIEGFTKAKKNADGSSRGPIRLRKEATDVKDLGEAKGATIGFVDNRLISGRGAWNSQGALVYPIRGNLDVGSGSWMEASPAISWQLAEAQDAGKKDVQDLKLSVPFTFNFGFSKTPDGPFDPNVETAPLSRVLQVQLEPYYDTDFSWGHEIWGATASLEYIGSLGSLYLGGFRALHDTDPASSDIGKLLMYRLRVRPQLDASVTEQGGEFTSRVEGDDWWRLGGEVSFDVRFGGKKSPFDLGGSYRYMNTVSGSGGNGTLRKAHLTWWLNEFTGLTVELQKGDTPVSDKAIDQITLGLELKY